MAFRRVDLFDPEKQAISILGKCLSHPARITIIESLAENGTTAFKDLSRLLPLSQATISSHLATMVRQGFIEVKEHVPTTYYSLTGITSKLYEDVLDLLAKMGEGGSGMIENRRFTRRNRI